MKLHLEADDIIAIVIIIGCIVLIWSGYDRVITSILLAVTSYYFGHKRPITE